MEKVYTYIDIKSWTFLSKPCQCTSEQLPWKARDSPEYHVHYLAFQCLEPAVNGYAIDYIRSNCCYLKSKLKQAAPHKCRWQLQHANILLFLYSTACTRLKLVSSFSLIDSHGACWRPAATDVYFGVNLKGYRIVKMEMEFHGIPWNCSCHRNWCTTSSMEFHGIPWNCWCHRNWRTPTSMEFHETARVSELGALEVPWNFMEFHGTARVSEIGALLVQWKTMELLVSAKLAHFKINGFHGVPWNCSCQRNWHTWSSMEFHGIPWNWSCHRNWRTPSSMEFHGTARVIEIGALHVPWDSMEFHGTARVIEIGALQARVIELGALQIPWNSMELLVSAKWRTLNSMEFHGTARVIEIVALQIPRNSLELFVSAKLAHFKFHGIPWNCSCQRNWSILSSMEFRETARVSEFGAPQVPWNSMEFLETARVSEIGALQVPWNFMIFPGIAHVSAIGALEVP